MLRKKALAHVKSLDTHVRKESWLKENFQEAVKITKKVFL